MYGGLVFAPVTREMVYSIPGAMFAALGARGRLLAQRISDYRENPDDELVVACYPPPTILPHKLTKGYGITWLSVLTHVNDEKVRNVRHLIQLIKANKGDFVVFRFEEDGEEKIVLEPKLVEKYQEQILRNNNIPAACSEDLRDVWP